MLILIIGPQCSRPLGFPEYTLVSSFLPVFLILSPEFKSHLFQGVFILIWQLYHSVIAL